MIDETRYEGCTAGPWKRSSEFAADLEDGIVICGHNEHGELFVCELVDEADANLIEDAPTLVAEVKRLRAALDGIGEHAFELHDPSIVDGWHDIMRMVNDALTEAKS